MERIHATRSRLRYLRSQQAASDAALSLLREGLARERVLLPPPSAAATTLIIARIVGADSVPISALEAQLMRIAGAHQGGELEAFLRARSEHFSLRRLADHKPRGGGAGEQHHAATTVVSLSYAGAVASNDVRSLLMWCGDERRRALRPSPRCRRVDWMWPYAARFAPRAGATSDLGPGWRTADLARPSASGSGWAWCPGDAALWIAAAACGAASSERIASSSVAAPAAAADSAGAAALPLPPPHESDGAAPPSSGRKRAATAPLDLFDRASTSLLAYRAFGSPRQRRRKMDPMRPLCRFELHGECRDPTCEAQHLSVRRIDEAKLGAAAGASTGAAAAAGAAAGPLRSSNGPAPPPAATADVNLSGVPLTLPIWGRPAAAASTAAAAVARASSAVSLNGGDAAATAATAVASLSDANSPRLTRGDALELVAPSPPSDDETFIAFDAGTAAAAGASADVDADANAGAGLVPNADADPAAQQQQRADDVADGAESVALRLTIEALQSPSRASPASVENWLTLALQCAAPEVVVAAAAAGEPKSAFGREVAAPPPDATLLSRPLRDVIPRAFIAHARSQQALHVLSAALQQHRGSEVLWLLYLHLFSAHARAEKKKTGASTAVLEVLEHASRTVPSSISMWRLYVEEAERVGMPTTQVVNLWSRAAAHFGAQLKLKQQLPEDATKPSSSLLEAALSIASTHALAGHTSLAIAFLQQMLIASPDAVQAMLPPHRLVLWVSYVHLVAWQRLPAQIALALRVYAPLPNLDAVRHPDVLHGEAWTAACTWSHAPSAAVWSGVRSAFKAALRGALTPVPLEGTAALDIEWLLPLMVAYIRFELVVANAPRAAVLCQRFLLRLPLAAELYALYAEVEVATSAQLGGARADRIFTYAMEKLSWVGVRVPIGGAEQHSATAERVVLLAARHWLARDEHAKAHAALLKFALELLLDAERSEHAEKGVDAVVDAAWQALRLDSSAPLSPAACDTAEDRFSCLVLLETLARGPRAAAARLKGRCLEPTLRDWLAEPRPERRAACERVRRVGSHLQQAARVAEWITRQREGGKVDDGVRLFEALADGYLSEAAARAAAAAAEESGSAEALTSEAGEEAALVQRMLLALTSGSTPRAKAKAAQAACRALIHCAAACAARAVMAATGLPRALFAAAGIYNRAAANSELNALGLRDDAELAVCGAAATLAAVQLSLSHSSAKGSSAAAMSRLHAVSFKGGPQAWRGGRGVGSDGGAALSRLRRALRSGGGWPASRICTAWRLRAALEVQRGTVAAAQRTLEAAAAACPHVAAVWDALVRFELEFGGGDRLRTTTLSTAIEATGVGLSLAEFDCEV